MTCVAFMSADLLVATNWIEVAAFFYSLKQIIGWGAGLFVVAIVVVDSLRTTKKP
jgi:uncharacterized PurR-regulated membrane protein YhhQ (DUF165 family)